MTPVVSVVLAARNEAARIDGAISSILAQTFEDWELLVIDDGSSDETAVIAERYGDERIRVIKREHRGLAASLNEGVTRAGARYIARQDADDISMPERLEMQIRFLDTYQEVAVVGGGWTEIGRDGREVRPRTPPVEGRVNEALLRFNPLVHTSVMFRREAFQRVGGYDESLRYAQDYDLWLRLDEAGAVIWNLPERLVVRNMTGANVAATQERAQIGAELRLRWLDLQRRRRSGRPVTLPALLLARRALVLAAPLGLKRLVRRLQGKEP